MGKLGKIIKGIYFQDDYLVIEVRHARSIIDENIRILNISSPYRWKESRCICEVVYNKCYTEVGDINDLKR